jgi:hypothetical protein
MTDVWIRTQSAAVAIYLSQEEVSNFYLRELKTFDSSIVPVPVLRIRIRDPVPFRPLDPGFGMGKKFRIRDEEPRSFFRELRNHFFG